MTTKPDIVIPYKRNRSNELVYALRSLKNLPHGKVFVIGDNPNLNVNHIPYRQGFDIAKNTLSILNLAVDTPEISDDFIWMADDMYIMQSIRKIPTLHRGSYDDLIEKYAARHHNFYVQRMIKTNKILKELGVKSPLCYELHIPVTINKKKWLRVSEHITQDLNKLSMYANLNNLGGTKTKDVKVRKKDWIPKGSFASSHERTFDTNSLGRKVRDMFGERSEYEK